MLRGNFLLLSFMGVVFLNTPARGNSYNWSADYDSSNALIRQIKTPPGYYRPQVETGSYAEWLRHLPIRLNQNEIYKYDGTPYRGHNANYAIVDIDIGTRDLLQCADIIMRFRAEFLYSRKMFDSISFTYTSGDTAEYINWREGFRPRVENNSVRWFKTAPADSSYSSFREYLDSVFMYAGTYSLSKVLKSVTNADSIRIGDSFILGGFPGHAIMVADMCINETTGDKLLLLIQGFTPAQDIHIIKNDSRGEDLPWFEMKHGDTLKILYWEFTEEHLRRF